MNNPRHASSVPAKTPRRSPRAAAETQLKRRFVEDYLAALLAQASHLISSEFHKVAREHGFSVSELSLIHI